MFPRRRTRVFAAKEATIVSQEGAFPCVIDNISLKGCLVQVGTDKGMALGSEVEFVMRLDPSNPEFDIRVRGHVVRREESVVALDFHELNPEGFHHLLRFIQYNSQNPSAIEQELASSAYSLEEKP